jgi:2-keto-4-pentenoate hydratase/2-oxohepta-3-ene-1,7-dioic acid hydratase in catechol pathway
MRIVAFERRGPPRGARRGELHDAYRGLEDLDEVPAGARVGALVAPVGGADGTGPYDLVDLHRALVLGLASEDVGAPEAEATSLLPSDPVAFLRLFPSAERAARRAEGFAARLLQQFGPLELAAAGALLRTAQVRLHAPVGLPRKILAVARNYPAHADEQGAARPEEPVLFLKASSAVIGPGEAIRLPEASREVDYEGELAVVIGRRAHQVPRSHALEHVAGYTAANDVSARDYQGVRGQHFIGKSFDSFAPLGPALVTREEIPDPQALALATRVSGETLQSASTKEMGFSVAELIEFTSRICTLEPGDVLLTGTPAGVGKARKPPRWLRDGDEVEVEIERIGVLRNPVRAETAGRG